MIRSYYICSSVLFFISLLIFISASMQCLHTNGRAAQLKLHAHSNKNAPKRNKSTLKIEKCKAEKEV